MHKTSQQKLCFNIHRFIINAVVVVVEPKLPRCCALGVIFLAHTHVIFGVMMPAISGEFTRAFRCANFDHVITIIHRLIELKAAMEKVQRYYVTQDMNAGIWYKFATAPNSMTYIK